MIFCVFHLDELRSPQEKITTIEIIKDTSLFFMIEDI